MNVKLKAKLIVKQKNLFSPSTNETVQIENLSVKKSSVGGLYIMLSHLTEILTNKMNEWVNESSAFWKEPSNKEKGIKTGEKKKKTISLKNCRCYVHVVETYYFTYATLVILSCPIQLDYRSVSQHFFSLLLCSAKTER